MKLRKGPLKLEGEYTTWTHVWTKDYGSGVTIDGLLVDNSGTVYGDAVSDGDVHVRTYAGVETDVADYGFLIWYTMASRSATGKYMLGWPMVSPWTVFEVWKDGVQTFSRDVTLDEAAAVYLFPFAISPSGEFVAVVVDKTSAVGSVVMLYEGS